MDKITKEQRSYIMSRIRGKNTSPELIVRKALWKAGLRGYRLHKKMTGNPDIVFIRAKLAIFIDGDFWHGYNFAKRKQTLPPYWVEKIKRNMKRDRKYSSQLKERGWDIIRIWEHVATEKSPQVIEEIALKLKEQGSKKTPILADGNKL